MIPLSVPNLSGNEWKYVKECLDTNWVSSVGSYVTRFEQQVAEFCGVRHAIATSNGTAALHISLLLAGVQPGDLVVLPNITFVAPANAIKYAGADPILVDVDAATWQMDLHLLEHFLDTETEQRGDQCFHRASGRRIAALLPVHVLGNMCAMDRLLALAARFALPVVEDSTEALGSYYKEKHAGSFGMFGTLSFNGNKIITTGGGGMILTSEEGLAKRAKHLTTQAKSEPQEYFHDEVGYNYRLVNILAAMGVAQMEQLPGFLERKKEIAARYAALFSGIGGVDLQAPGSDVQPNNWLFTIRADRQPELRQYLLEHKVEVRPFWVPMNRLPAFAEALYVTDADVAGSVYGQCLSLPCSTGLTDAELETVIGLIQKFYHG
ncbi:MAG TPA: LegC family aminotransferase [Chitinophagaceae bacterium]|jgi:perosamine synthetase|nr:LegC family aminotransferase [Chitinophagaceae bacterium]